MADGAVALNTDGKRRFAAFISYAHADAAIAAKLQAKLERYRLPKHIAQGRTRGGAALGQIFRDREDLAAAPSLSDAIRAAIAEAEALVVICSPEARNSRWVGEEIALFRKLHPERPILAAIVRGELGEAFPEALTAGGTEPLAADLRAGGDGEALGFLKIVAGIAGVPLDALVQRDAQRRLRRVMWITGGALAAMLVMAVMTTLALQARNEAARQRESAEGLVEYMLTDLREKLKGVGRLDVMEGVNKRAMEHYQRQGNLIGLPADILERRARVLHAMGEDDQSSDEHTLALAKFQEAHRTTEALLARDPDNTDRIFAHSQSKYWVGYAAFRAKQSGKTLKHFMEYKRLAERLVQLDPKKVEWTKEVGYANGNLCTQYLTEPVDTKLAIGFCTSALQSVRKYAQAHPDDLQGKLDLANRYAWLSDALFEAGQVDQAWQNRMRQLELLNGILARDPKNADYQLEWVQFHLATAKFPQVRENWTKNQSTFRKAITILDHLILKDPSNDDIRNYKERLEKKIDEI